MIKIAVKIIGQTFSLFIVYVCTLYYVLCKFEFFLPFILYGQTSLLITINN